MPTRDLVIQNELGMHARPASEFTKLAGRFRAGVFVSCNGTEVNGKSIMGLLMLAAGPGVTITVRTEGEDADEAMDALTALVESRFGEER